MKKPLSLNKETIDRAQAKGSIFLGYRPSDRAAVLEDFNNLFFGASSPLATKKVVNSLLSSNKAIYKDLDLVVMTSGNKAVYTDLADFVSFQLDRNVYSTENDKDFLGLLHSMIALRQSLFENQKVGEIREYNKKIEAIGPAYRPKTLSPTIAIIDLTGPERWNLSDESFKAFAWILQNGPAVGIMVSLIMPGKDKAPPLFENLFRLGQIKVGHGSAQTVKLSFGKEERMDVLFPVAKETLSNYKKLRTYCWMQ